MQQIETLTHAIWDTGLYDFVFVPDSIRTPSKIWESMLLLGAAFATNCHPPPSLPPLPLLLGRHHRHRHHHDQNHHCPLPKKEATAAAPPAYQRQNQRKNIYKSRQLGLI
jgi:hypothetical protein